MTNIRTKKVQFKELKPNDRFQFDGELFVKTGTQVAWSIQAGIRYKEWAFLGDEQVTLLIIN